MSLVSVIMPAYNAAPWIAEAIGSVLAQTWRELEVIVVDDGSKDGTAEVVAGIGDPRVRLIRQENRGQSAALNRGVAEARGDWIKFVDADDWINSGHLEAQVGALAAHPEAVACCRWGYFLDRPREARVREERVDRDYEDPLEWLVDSLTKDEGMMGGWRWLIPRVVWQRCGGWDESLGLNNDFDLSIRLLLASSGVRFAPDALYAYRKGVSGALSSAWGEKAMRSAFGTTMSGCRALLAREDSARIRRICADRWQGWLYRFYPEHPEFARRAEEQVGLLGGSDLRLDGGRLLRSLLPVLGWKRVRWLQERVYRWGWAGVLGWKSKRRLRRIR